MNIAIVLIIAFWVGIYLANKHAEKKSRQAIADYQQDLKKILMKIYLDRDEKKYSSMRTAFGRQDYYDPSWVAAAAAESIGCTVKEFKVWQAYGHGLEQHSIVNMGIGNDIAGLLGEIEHKS